MSFDEEYEQHEKESASTSDFYKFAIGDHIMRIMTEPVKKASRYGHGICYPGAPYCSPEVIEKEYEEKMEVYGREVEEARKKGATEKDLKKIKKPSRANINVKWVVWAFVRIQIIKGKAFEVNDFKVVDLSNTVAGALYSLKNDAHMGTGFKEFPMPYDVKISVTQKKMANPTPKDIEYSLVAGQKMIPVSDDLKDVLSKKITIPDLMERMYAKQKERTEGPGDSDDGGSTGIDYPQEEINPDDIPF